MLKKISMSLLFSGLLIFNAVPASASANTSTSTNTSSSAKVVSAAAQVSLPLTDGQPITETMGPGAPGTFTVNASDSSLRNISIFGASFTKATISDSLGLSLQFDSGTYRPSNSISWHFIPGVQYTITVYPQDTGNITISMSKQTSAVYNWIYQGTSTTVQQNYLYGGTSEAYGIAFAGPGTYNISVATTGSLNVDYKNGTYQESFPITSGSHTVSVIVNSQTYDQSGVMLNLTSKDATGSAGKYTVSVVKVR